LFGKKGTKLCSAFYTVIWRRDVLVAERVPPPVGPTIFEVPNCSRSVGWDVRPVLHGFLAVSRHCGLFGDVVVTDGATIETALDSVVRRCLAKFENSRKRGIVQFPSVQCGETNTEDIGNFKIGHAALTALSGDYSQPWAIDGFATAAAVAEAAPIAERRASFQ
jgi:hypothetical protein